MAKKTVVQEEFGNAVLQAVSGFARKDLRTVEQLQLEEFAHVADPQLRQALAETFYGARWIYKIGLALLVKDLEQMAHVRAQVLDYGAVCEGLLSDCILHGVETGTLNGEKHRFADTANLQKPINWNVRNKLFVLRKLSFHWHIEVAEQEGVVSSAAARRLHAMRGERNTIHLRERTYRAFIGTSRSLFETTTEIIAATKAWRQSHP